MQIQLSNILLYDDIHSSSSSSSSSSSYSRFSSFAICNFIGFFNTLGNNYSPVYEKIKCIISLFTQHEEFSKVTTMVINEVISSLNASYNHIYMCINERHSPPFNPLIFLYLTPFIIQVTRKL